MPIKYYC